MRACLAHTRDDASTDVDGSGATKPKVVETGEERLRRVMSVTGAGIVKKKRRRGPDLAAVAPYRQLGAAATPSGEAASPAS